MVLIHPGPGPHPEADEARGAARPWTWAPVCACPGNGADPDGFRLSALNAAASWAAPEDEAHLELTQRSPEAPQQAEKLERPS